MRGLGAPPKNCSVIGQLTPPHGELFSLASSCLLFLSNSQIRPCCGRLINEIRVIPLLLKSLQRVPVGWLSYPPCEIRFQKAWEHDVLIFQILSSPVAASQFHFQLEDSEIDPSEIFRIFRINSDLFLGERVARWGSLFHPSLDL